MPPLTYSQAQPVSATVHYKLIKLIMTDKQFIINKSLGIKRVAEKKAQIAFNTRELNKRKKLQERGQASILVELEDGNITVKHGSEHAILLEKKSVKAGSWDKIWEVLNNL